MHLTTLIKAFALATSIGITSAAPVSNDLVSRQTLGVPGGQDPTSSDCYQWFNADEYSDMKSAAFGNQAGPCTFYPFIDNSYNYTCSEECIAPDYVESTFQEFPNGTLFNSGKNSLYVYAYEVAQGQTISLKERPVQLMLSFVQSL
ncbi:MAG: hypothetical protein LQ340_004013 [Diploschistes diacapsis]|nr:MAG: hypothetical protein LQ340_004013 [Diploschistes diacapsis]